MVWLMLTLVLTMGLTQVRAIASTMVLAQVQARAALPA
jgi:hypothetical protein